MKNLQAAAPIAIVMLLAAQGGCVYQNIIEIVGDAGIDAPADQDLEHEGPATPTTYPVCPLGWTCDDFTYPVTNPAPPVDILVVVDNSGSMAAEQENLKTAFPDLIGGLLDPPIDPATGRRIQPPVRDLHLGVISTDMGVAGYSVPTCGTNPFSGDDGLLQSEPHGTGCAYSYPEFLTYLVPADAEPNLSMVNQLAFDFGCIAMLGTEGCGFEQQMEAAYKAVTVNTQPGGANQGFARSDSILALLFVTDEDDCSAADNTIFDVNALTYSINLQCYFNSAKLHAVSRYAEAMRSVKSDPEKLVVGMIVGVPPGEPDCNGSGDTLGLCLELPDMIEKVRSDGELLEYVCKYPPACTPMSNCISEAFPARRFVELAQLIGKNAVVQSICTSDFGPALASLTSKISESIKSYCTLGMRATVEKVDSCHCRSNCRLVEMLGDDRPCSSGKSPYSYGTDPVTDKWTDPSTGRRHSLCEVPSALTTVSDCLLSCIDPSQRYTPGSSGWYYLPVSGESPCPRIEITSDMQPDPGSSLILMCP
jgi:hypothetical protein